MRKIKFRAWDKKWKEWLNPKEHVIYACNGDVGEVNDDELVEDIVHDTVVEQFTGLHDKNGKEIYEGDIVKVVGLFGFEFTGQVVYDRFGFNLKDFWCSGFDDPDLAFSEEHDWQVIGNIHENPELLEKIDG